MFLKIDDILISLGVILLTSGKGYNCKLDSQSGIIFFFFFLEFRLFGEIRFVG